MSSIYWPVEQTDGTVALVIRQDGQRQWHEASANVLTQAGLNNEAEKLRRCHDGKHFSAIRSCSKHPEHRSQVIPYGCRLAVCPICSQANATELERRYAATALHHAHSGNRDRFLSHVVLTTPISLNDPRIFELYPTLWDAAMKTILSTLRSVLKAELSESERRRGTFKWKSHQVGVLTSADWGPEGNKLHFHSLLYGPFIERDLLRDHWMQATHGEAEGVWIRKTPSAQRAIANVIKYVAKLSPVSPQLVPQLHMLLEGRRRIRSKGIFYGKKQVPRRVSNTCPHCGAALITIAIPSQMA